MKRLAFTSLALAGLVLALSAPAHAQQTTGAAPEPELKTDREKSSYAVGLGLGANLVRREVDVDLEKTIMGFRDAYQRNQPKLSPEEIQSALRYLQTSMMRQREIRAKAAMETNTKAGEAFLVENGKQAGVVTLPSGLQYKVIKAGTGATPAASDRVKTHYRGTLIDGQEFDSSHKRGQPAVFPVSAVIKGWTEALQLMKVGAEWQLFIPPHLAYGDLGAGEAIGPGSTLIFEINLIAIEK